MKRVRFWLLALAGIAVGGVLAAPLALDLARLALLSQRRGEVGVLRHLACFFKSPMGVEEHDFFKQFALLEEYTRQIHDQVVDSVR